MAAKYWKQVTYPQNIDSKQDSPGGFPELPRVSKLVLSIAN